MTVRPYAGSRDLPRLLDLLAACRAGGLVDMEYRSIELRLSLKNPTLDPSRHTLLLESPDGELLAFALLWGGDHLGLLIHPRARGRLERTILDWASERIGEGNGAARPLWALCRDDDAPRCAFFERHGFVVGAEELRMARALDGPIPEPVLPAGFALRPLAADELDDWLALYAEAFGPRAASLLRWRAYRADPDYDRALDLVAVDPGGELAAFGTCTIPSFERERGGPREGRTEPIAVRPRWRRRGIARALVLSGLHLLRARGMDVAALTTEADNAPAHRLYRSLGYREIYRARWYVRPRPDPDVRPGATVPG